VGSSASASPGGKGGAGATIAGTAANNHDVGGGGGGGVGRIRVNSGTPTLSGLLSPTTSTAAATTGPLVTRPLLR